MHPIRIVGCEAHPITGTFEAVIERCPFLARTSNFDSTTQLVAIEGPTLKNWHLYFCQRYVSILVKNRHLLSQYIPFSCPLKLIERRTKRHLLFLLDQLQEEGGFALFFWSCWSLKHTRLVFIIISHSISLLHVELNRLLHTHIKCATETNYLYLCCTGNIFYSFCVHLIRSSSKETT